MKSTLALLAVALAWPITGFAFCGLSVGLTPKLRTAAAYALVASGATVAAYLSVCSNVVVVSAYLARSMAEAERVQYARALESGQWDAHRSFDGGSTAPRYRQSTAASR